MALSKIELITFFKELLRASKDFKSKEIVFVSEWVYLLPTQSLSISDNMLHLNYNIPTGWNGYGKVDLNKLVEIGCLKIITESEEDPLTLEKIIKYQIIESNLKVFEKLEFFSEKDPLSIENESTINKEKSNLLVKKHTDSFNKKEFNYYTHIIDGGEVVIRVIANGSIGDNVLSIEVFKNQNWVRDKRVTKSFMSSYITGWVTDNDIIDEIIINEHIVTGITCRTIKARNLALEKHKNQKYGIYAYKIHLTNVVNVLLHFGVDFKEDVLIMSAWLHDILEDTNTSKSLLFSNFGEEVREIVELVSNCNDTAKTNVENKRATFTKISTNDKAIIIKLADRIANVEFSLLHGNIEKIKKYKEEQELIDDLISSKITSVLGKSLYNYLQKLTDSIKL